MASPIFVVDSSPAVRRMVERFQPLKGLVVGFQDGPAALEAARQLAITDHRGYHLDNMTFPGFCKESTNWTTGETYLISLVNRLTARTKIPFARWVSKPSEETVSI